MSVWNPDAVPWAEEDAELERDEQGRDAQERLEDPDRAEAVRVRALKRKRYREDGLPPLGYEEEGSYGARLHEALRRRGILRKPRGPVREEAAEWVRARGLALEDVAHVRECITGLGTFGRKDLPGVFTDGAVHYSVRRVLTREETVLGGIWLDYHIGRERLVREQDFDARQHREIPGGREKREKRLRKRQLRLSIAEAMGGEEAAAAVAAGDVDDGKIYVKGIVVVGAERLLTQVNGGGGGFTVTFTEVWEDAKDSNFGLVFGIIDDMSTIRMEELLFAPPMVEAELLLRRRQEEEEAAAAAEDLLFPE